MYFHWDGVTDTRYHGEVRGTLAVRFLFNSLAIAVFRPRFCVAPLVGQVRVLGKVGRDVRLVLVVRLFRYVAYVYQGYPGYVIWVGGRVFVLRCLA